jgi:hypothetical protein
MVCSRAEPGRRPALREGSDRVIVCRWTPPIADYFTVGKSGLETS